MSVTFNHNLYDTFFREDFGQPESARELALNQTLARKPEYHGVQETVMTYGEELLQEGIDQGELGDKRAVLTRLLDRKFGLSDAERARIEASEDRVALDAALDEFALATLKSAVLSRLP